MGELRTHLGKTVVVACWCVISQPLYLCQCYVNTPCCKTMQFHSSSFYRISTVHFIIKCCSENKTSQKKSVRKRKHLRISIKHKVLFYLSCKLEITLFYVSLSPPACLLAFWPCQKENNNNNNAGVCFWARNFYIFRNGVKKRVA